MNWKKVSFKFLKIALKSVLYFLLFILLYLLSAYLLSRIEIPREKSTDKKEIAIFIKSNGVHTDLVLPVKNKLFDWSSLVPTENTQKKDSLFSYLAFGWGDKGFYLNTPTWGDLTFSTAFKAATGLGTTAIHTTYYSEMQEKKLTCIKIYITKKQYQRLVNYIYNSFEKTKKGSSIFIKTDAVYGDNDAFYEATGNYNLFSTCNSWANKGLIASGQKAALWTAFQGGIFCHY